MDYQATIFSEVVFASFKKILLYFSIETDENYKRTPDRISVCQVETRKGIP
jgi:hypothetical protein